MTKKANIRSSEPIYKRICNDFVPQLIGGVLTHLTTAGAKKCITEEKEDIAQTLGITNK